jgi:hypothetical protein
MRTRQLAWLLWLYPAVLLANPPAANLGCEDALEQVKALKSASPVYQQGSGEERRYLEDPARPAELKRLEGLVASSCSSNPAQRAAQEAASLRLLQALSPECAIERDWLATMEKPGSRDPPEDVAAKRALVNAKCPQVAVAGRWLVQLEGASGLPPLEN